jgi:hypothetical protein
MSTVLSPDADGAVAPSGVLPAFHLGSDPGQSDDLVDAESAAADRVAEPSDVPGRLLPLQESLVPIPGPYEHMMPRLGDSKPERLSDREQRHTVRQ